MSKEIHVEKFKTITTEPAFWSKNCSKELNALELNIWYDRLACATLSTKINLLLDLRRIDKQRMIKR